MMHPRAVAIEAAVPSGGELPFGSRESTLLPLRALSRRVPAYALAAGLAAAVNVLSRMGFNMWLDFAASVAAGYVLGMFVNFAISRRYVFTDRAKRHVIVDFAVFALVAGAGLVSSTLASLAALELLAPLSGETEAIRTAAHLFGVGFAFVLNYLGHALVTFRPATKSGRLTA